MVLHKRKTKQTRYNTSVKQKQSRYNTNVKQKQSRYNTNVKQNKHVTTQTQEIDQTGYNKRNKIQHTITK